MPWRVIAPNLNFSLVPYGGHMVGLARFTGGTVAIQDFTPMAASLATRFSLEGGLVKLHHIDLLTDGADFRRMAAFREFPLPGGEKAIREPRRSALGMLRALRGEDLFDLRDENVSVVLGSARMLADQPEFAASNARMRELLELTETRETLASALDARSRLGVTVTIGGENADPRLAGFTLVTSSYRTGEAAGVIGVMGPTRMPYDKIVSLVDHTSRLVEGLLS